VTRGDWPGGKFAEYSELVRGRYRESHELSLISESHLELCLYTNNQIVIRSWKFPFGWLPVGLTGLAGLIIGTAGQEGGEKSRDQSPQFSLRNECVQVMNEFQRYSAMAGFAAARI
jgi:hypothetical protein